MVADNSNPDAFDPGLPDNEMQAIIAQLESEEGQSRDAALSSQQGFLMWMLDQSQFQHMEIYQSIDKVAAAVFSFVRALFTRSKADDNS